MHTSQSVVEFNEMLGRHRKTPIAWMREMGLLGPRTIDPVLGAEGAVLFLERVSPALEHVDSSSGGIGTAVNHAVEELVAVIARPPVDGKTREGWLDRLWEAHANDAIPYIEGLGDFWGELCVSPETASAWADQLVPIVEMALSPDPQRRGYFHGTTACLTTRRSGSRIGRRAIRRRSRGPRGTSPINVLPSRSRRD